MNAEKTKQENRQINLVFNGINYLIMLQGKSIVMQCMCISFIEKPQSFS